MKLIFSICALVLSCFAQVPNNCNNPNWHSLETNETARLNCGPAFQDRCLCYTTCYDGHHQHVVNCTNSGFYNTKPLSHLPNNTQVLIFTGNSLDVLPWNVFGTLDSLPELRVIDMSSNKIREIHGKSYHHVQRVERLILNYNRLTMDPERSHPRIFSNFVSLLELHLTHAFDTGSPQDLAATLHDIFVNSNLTQLIKLHLEQNNISEFRDSNVFCDLPNLLDLHLGDNALTKLHFNLSCLHKLRFLDLQRNKFSTVIERDLHTLDTFAKHNQSVTVDFSGNPFECTCKLNPFLEWMKRTKIFVRNKDLLRCYQNGSVQEFHTIKGCITKLKASSYRGTKAAVYLLITILVALICALIYLQRTAVRKRLDPVIDSVSRRVRYTSITTSDTREIDV
ncbi:trophoblast glycoprotein isoform X2 [Orussus abietinus]|nr:trophoblast glycoprotein isoform X2 [Orussus abietinus]XP_012275955.1 trophoblast glycoprotein isoform X2 [Orussus abietinus]